MDATFLAGIKQVNLDLNDCSLGEHPTLFLSVIYYDSRNGSSPHLRRIVHVTRNDRRFEPSKGPKFTSREVRRLFDQTFKSRPGWWGWGYCFRRRKIFILRPGIMFLIFCWSDTCRFSPSRGYEKENTCPAGSPCPAGILSLCRLFTRDRAIDMAG